VRQERSETEPRIDGQVRDDVRELGKNADK